MAQQDNYIGIAFGLDVTSLKAGLAETEKAIKQAKTEFLSATSGMDNWKDTVGGVSAELDFLNTKLENQKKNVNGYQAEIEELTKKYGENSAQVQRAKKGLAEEQQAMAKTESAIREKTSRLNMLEGAYVDTITDADQLQGSIRKLDAIMRDQKRTVADYESQLARARDEHGENSEEVKELTSKLNKAKAVVKQTENAHEAYTSQLNKVQSETTETTSDTKKMTNALKDADSATIELKGGFSVLKGAMADLVSNGIQNIISGFKSAIDESREFRQEMSFLEATADDSGASFDQVQDKVKDVYAVFGETDSAVEGMNNLMSAGFLDGENLDQITDQLIGASIKWKDTLKFEGLADGLQETLATGSAVGPFAELLERAGVKLEDFDDGLAKCKTDAEKQNYVLQQLNKLGLSEITEGYRESNKELVEGAEAQFEYEQAMANFGEKTEPILTTIKKGVIDILNAFIDLFAGADLEGLKNSIEGAFKWFVAEVVPIIKEIINFVIENKDVILALIAGIGAGFLAWKVVTIIQGIITATKLWWTTTEGLTLAQKLLNTVMAMNPIGLVIAAIAALVAIFVVLWNKCDWFREFWIDLWDKIKKVAKDVWKAIQKFFVDAWASIQKAWSVAVKWFQNLWNGIKKVFSSVVSFFTTTYSNAWKGVKKIWSVVVSWFQNIWDGIKKVFSAVVTFYATIYGNAWKAIKNAWSTVVSWFQNIWTSIKNVFSAVSSWFGQKFRTAWNNVKNAWAAAGSFFSGIWAKIKSAFSSVGSTIGGYFRTAWNNVKNAWSSVSTFFSGILTKIKNVFSNIKDTFKNIGKDMMNGIKEGVKSKVESVKKAVKNGVEKAVDGVKSFLGINSPSKLMRDEIGKMMGEGVGVGIAASTKGVLKDAQKFTKSIAGGLAVQASDINAGLNGSIGSVRGSSFSGAPVTNVTNNYTQTINAPKSPSRIELYRQTKNLLSYQGGQ